MKGDLQQILGHNIRLRREQLELSQEQLANQLGFHRTYIGALERGERNVSLQSLEELAKRLKVDPLDLIQVGKFPPSS